MSQITNLGAANGGGGANTFVTDAGNAVPAAGIITFNAISQAGSTVLFSGSGSTVRLNVTDVSHNTFIGQQSGNAATAGGSNTGLGYQAMNAAIASSDNTGIGATALKNLTSGGQNTALGSTALATLQTGDANTAIGVNAMFDANGATRNVAVGNAANGDCTTGTDNVTIGWTAGRLLTTGSYNIMIGSAAGGNPTFTDSNNIMIGNIGTIGDNNKIIIGTQGAGAGQQNTCFIAGINGVTSANARMVTINSVTNQLGEQAIPSGNISITGDSGGALSSNAFTFTGGSTGLTFAGAGTTETLGGTLAIANGGTNATSMSTSTGIVKYDGTRLVTSTTALIDSSNRMTNTSQPSFFAYNASTRSNVTGDGTVYTVPFEVELFDQGNNYDAAGTFTAPVTGKYRFSGQVGVAVDTSAATAYQARLTTTANTITGYNTSTIGPNNWFYVHISCIVPMTAGDTSKFQVVATGGTKNADVTNNTIWHWFGGELVC